MSASTNPTSLMLTGHLPFVLLLAGLIAFPLSLLLLRLYKRAVVRSMRTSAATTVEPRDPHVAPETGANREAFRNADQLRDVALTAPRKAAVIYAAAGSAYAVVMTAAFLLASDIPFLPGRAVVLFWNFVWPVALAVMLIAAPTWRRKSVILVGYFAVLCGGSFFGLDWKQVVAIWAYANLGATLLLLFFLTRGIRAVGPMVFTFVLLALVGCEVAIDLLAYDVQHRGSVAHAALSAGLNAFSYLTLVAIAGIAVFSVFGWLGMRWIGRRYERKKVTDQSITLDAIWIVFAVVHAVFLALNGPAWSLASIAAFVIYKAVLAIGFRLWRPSGAYVPRLVILRVFSLGRRSQRMFNALAQHWRYIGSIQLIAGPDLATTTVEPHEFLAFLGGKLSRQFIDGAETFRRRLGEVDLKRDFDGRFRVNDFFCNENAWRLVLSGLIRETDAVLMDLRGFTRANAGCVFELQELMKLGEPARVLFMVDETTDQAFLNETLGNSATQFRFLHASGRRGELRNIIGSICQAAQFAPAST